MIQYDQPKWYHHKYQLVSDLRKIVPAPVSFELHYLYRYSVVGTLMKFHFKSRYYFNGERDTITRNYLKIWERIGFWSSRYLWRKNMLYLVILSLQ